MASNLCGLRFLPATWASAKEASTGIFATAASCWKRLLARWEDGELGWLDAEIGSGAATRWANFVKRTSDPERVRTEIALRAWARADERVAARVAVIEKRKTRLIVDVLRDIGFTQPAADSGSEMVLLICLGWLDRATRDPHHPTGGGQPQ